MVDTCVWSLALRSADEDAGEIVQILKNLILDQKVQMIGPIRQELLSGIRSEKQFKTLKTYLSAFPDLAIQSQDHELAAEYFNVTRKNGIQGTNTDFLLCAMSHNHEMSIFTTDKDFDQYAKYCPIILYAV